MTSISFIPTDDAGKDLWGKNFANKLPQYAAKYSISAAEVTEVQNGVASFTYNLNLCKLVEEHYHRMSSFKNEVRDGIKAGSTPSVLPAFPSPGTAPAAVPPGVYTRLKSLALRIRKHYSFTEADGKDLGIISIIETAIDFTTVKPVLKVRLVNNGQPEILWTKKNMTAIVLYVDRGNGYEQLAIDHIPNYVDTTTLSKGQTGVWKYKGIYLHGDEKVGLFSDEVNVTVTGMD